MTFSPAPDSPRDDMATLLLRVQALEAESAALQQRLDRQTQQLAQARQLSSLGARHQLVAEAARAAPWEWDLTTGQVSLGGRWGAIVGEVPNSRDWPMSELEARVHPQDLPALREAAREAIHGKAHRYLVEHRVATRKGWVWIESVGLVTERGPDGRALRMSGYNIDITQRRTLQEEMAQARAEAEASNRAKSEFVANMSHEVRTPLHAVLGLARLLQQSPLDSEQRHCLALIDSAATSLLVLLNDVLDLSKVEAGKLVFEQVRFDVRQWVREAVELHAATAREKGLALRLSIAEEMPQMLEGDPGRLRQVISNLVANAVKFTAHGQVQVRVDLAPDPQNLPPAQLRVHFEVRDTGIGIDASMHASIFEAFTQADSSITRSHGGTGLGLAICARLVAMMGGRITVQSQPGQGSTFGFDVVLQRASAGAPSVLPEPEPQSTTVLRGLHVLLAEDHAVNELLMRKLLEPMGCRLSVARDGGEAVRLWQAGDVDLVLMDLQMPVLSGFEATTRIRAQEEADPAQGHTPIVALTAHAMARDRERSLAAGMDAYASKPVSPAMLMQAIEQAIVAAYEFGEGPLAAADALASPPAQAPAADVLASPPVQAPADGAPLPTGLEAPWQGTDAVPAWERDSLLALLGGQQEVLREAAQIMRADLAQRVVTLRRALDARDGASLRMDAHALRGALSAISAPHAAHLAHVLEDSAAGADWSRTGLSVQALLDELARVDRELAAVLPPAPPVPPAPPD